MDPVIAAIGDPTRRRILELLARQSRTAGQLAAEFSVSRPAVSRHLRVLRESGVVVDRIAGRHRIYALDPAAFDQLSAWLGSLRPSTRLHERMDALATEVHRAARDRRKADDTM